MTNEELKTDILCNKQAFWYKAVPVSCAAIAHVAIPHSKLSPSTRLGIFSLMSISLMGAIALARTSKMEVFLKELPDSNTGKSLSEALIFASTNPQFDIRLFIESQLQYV